MNKITILPGGRFLSIHPEGTTVYYDCKHKVIKCACDGGIIIELVREYVDGEFIDQLMTITYVSGKVTVMDYRIDGEVR